MVRFHLEELGSRKWARTAPLKTAYVKTFKFNEPSLDRKVRHRKNKNQQAVVTYARVTAERSSTKGAGRMPWH